MLTEREKYISLIDNDFVSLSDAIIILEGDGLNRIKHAASLYNKGLGQELWFSGHIDCEPYGSYILEKCYSEFNTYGISKNDIHHEDKSQNTYEQAIEIMKICIDKKWRSIIITASPYHQYRVFLTFLKAMNEFNFQILIFNSPTRNLPWFNKEEWGTRFELLDQEFRRIELYQEKGHVSTYKEGIEYFKWKEKNLIGSN